MIASLETNLGVKLLKRSTRKVELTEKGVMFYKISKNYLNQCLALSNNQLMNSHFGSINISMGNVVDNDVFPDLLNMFSEQYPEISISTQIIDAEAMIQGIRNNNIDIGLISSFSSSHASDLKQELLCSKRLQIVVWKGHPLSSRKLVQLNDLVNENFVFLVPGKNRGNEMLNLLCSMSGFKPHVTNYLSDFRLMFMSVSQKQGICFNLTSPEYTLFNNLVCIDIDRTEYPECAQQAGISLIWSEKSENPSTPLFIDCFHHMKKQQCMNQHASLRS